MCPKIIWILGWVPKYVLPTPTPLPLPMERRQHHFGVEWKFQLGRKFIFIYMTPTVAECARKSYGYWGGCPSMHFRRRRRRRCRCQWNGGNTILEWNGNFHQVEMTFLFIWALQLQNVPENHMDIRVGAQICVTDADAAAIADGTAATPFRSGIDISIR